MRFLLDSNVLSEPLLEKPSRRVLEKLDRFAGVICTASIVWHELHFGAWRLPPSRKRERVEAYLSNVVASLPILGYDAEAAAWHAMERARVEKSGVVLGHADGQIAAIAQVNGLVLVTRNLRHFAALAKVVEISSWHG